MPVRKRLIACLAITLPTLVRAQALDPSTYVASRWTSVCDDARRHLLKQ